MHYGLNELFTSIQGEGIHLGRTATFVRLQGCPVGCHWCDSKLTWFAGGTQHGPDELALMVLGQPPADLIVITGGEPTIYDLDPLIDAFRSVLPRRPIHLETSGAVPYRGTLWPDWITLSPKHAADWHVDPAIATKADELKFVADENLDLAVVKRIGRMTMFALPGLMPEGAPPSDRSIARTLELVRANPWLRYFPRLHYTFPQLAEWEGDNNATITADDARDRARQHVGTR